MTMQCREHSEILQPYKLLKKIYFTLIANGKKKYLTGRVNLTARYSLPKPNWPFGWGTKRHQRCQISNYVRKNSNERSNCCAGLTIIKPCTT